METLEEIIQELNPSCKIGEYRDRILEATNNSKPVVKCKATHCKNHSGKNCECELIEIDIDCHCNNWE